MRTVIRALIVVVILGWALGWTSTALAISCGLPPLPPLPALGCREMRPTCVCNSHGECEWVFVCVPE